MSGQALYRRWRPQTYADVRGQEHVTRTLRNALSSGRIGHAYLFAGPRGTGKTSVARILAKAVNCLADPDDRPCNECRMCLAIREGRLLDLLEIDAASNRGIDEVRDLRDKIGFVPTEARYKVYILDEAHMLTGPAFNALLKTLEEPPAHVIFILVTTDPHKIAATILSRCQRFDFHRLTIDEIVAQLGDIAQKETLQVDAAALEAIAKAATGSLRDAISLLDQMRSYGRDRITVQQLQETLGHAGDEDIQQLVDHMQTGDVPAGLTLINDLVGRGVDVHFMLQQILDYLRELLVMQVGGEQISTGRTAEITAQMRHQGAAMGKNRLLQVIRIIMDATDGLRAGAQSHLPLELAFIEVAMSGAPELIPAVVHPRQAARPARGRRGDAITHSSPAATAASGSSTEGAEPRAATTSLRETSEATAVVREPTAEKDSPEAGPEPSEAPGTVVEDPTALVELRGRWSDILSEVRGHSRKAEAALRSGCKPVAIEGNLVTLIFRDSFIMGMIEDEDQLGSVETAMANALGRPLRLRCILEQDWSTLRGRGGGESVETAHRAPVREETEQSSIGSVEDDRAAPDDEALDPVVKEAISKYGATLVGKSSGR